MPCRYNVYIPTTTYICTVGLLMPSDPSSVVNPQTNIIYASQPLQVHDNPKFIVRNNMDREAYEAALQVALSWLHDATICNFGRFNEALNSQFYKLLKLSFPLLAEWDEKRKTQIRDDAKCQKRKIYHQALSRLAIDDGNSKLQQKAIIALSTLTQVS